MSHKFNINLSAPTQTQSVKPAVQAAKPARLANGRFAPKTTAQLPPTKTPRKRPSRAKSTQASQPAQLVNHVAVLVDVSASMQGLTTALNKNFADLISNLGQKQANQQTFISVYTFGSRITQLSSAADASTIKHNFSCHEGSTALFSAVKKATQDFSAMKCVNDPNTSFLLLVLTDGYENYSDHVQPTCTAAELVKLFADKQATDHWTFTFQVPKGNKTSLVRMGIPDGNINEWEQTSDGLAQTTQSTNIGTQSYFTARAAGQTSVKGFYQTDLSGVTKKDLSKLTDLSGQYKLHNVQTEEAIKAFVESRLKINYASGIAFYQLMKKEKIQAGKQLLIMDKVSRKIWGGLEARNLLGLPTTADCFVDPLNHGAYEVFVQSTSVNRKLPRGTKILVKV